MSKGAIVKGLHSPLLLLIIGALVSSYLIPHYTRVWQEELEVQKELELKTELVSDMSEAVASFLLKTQQVKTILTIPAKEFYDSYLDWESTSSRIDSKLAAYYSGLPLQNIWTNYSAVLSSFARLSISTDMCTRAGYVEVIQKYFSTHLDGTDYVEDNCTEKPYDLDRVYSSPFPSDVVNIDWDELVRHGNQSRLSNSWLELKQNMFDQKDKLIQQILHSRIQAFT
jgi:hypothetical protein